MKLQTDEIIRKHIPGARHTETLETDPLTLEIVQAYRSHIAQLERVIEELKIYKEREIDAFAIGDAISDGICLADGSGVVIAVNRGYTEITGLTEKEAVGRPLAELQGKGFFSKSVTLSVIEKKEKVSALSSIARTNKKVLITGNPFFNDKGEVIQVLTVMRDLTELLRTQEKLEQLERESEKYLHELNYLRSQQWQQGLVGESLDMARLKELISYVARTDTTILINGETGTGKELVAKEIHDQSLRKDAPYIKVNCAAIPESLLESELFGYEKGAFTGALNKEKIGLFEMAEGGTLLLDEIGEMPIQLQSKLLRVLQERELRRIGGTQSIRLNVRVMAATNQDLKANAQSGKFREDLYYRLNVVPLTIPPLRERRDDISRLAAVFLARLNAKYGKEKTLDARALIALETYSWPGNVRELENVVERLLVSDNDPVITLERVTAIIGPGREALKQDMTLKEAVEALEKSLIQGALKKQGSTYKAAKALGMSQPTLFRKAKALGLTLQNDSKMDQTDSNMNYTEER